MSRKKVFNVTIALTRVRTAVHDLPKAELFALAADGFDSVFEVLVACILSIRTLDEVSLPAARRLFELGRTPAALAGLPVDRIDAAIRPCTFHGAKAEQIRALAQAAHERYGETLPCEAPALLAFRGVGPKCANLTLGIACGQPVIGVDIHVHRVTNRWGYVQARTPEETMEVLNKTLPRRYRVEINSLLVPFGKTICTGTRPHCSTCPLLDMCKQVGVTTHR